MHVVGVQFFTDKGQFSNKTRKPAPVSGEEVMSIVANTQDLERDPTLWDTAQVPPTFPRGAHSGGILEMHFYGKMCWCFP